MRKAIVATAMLGALFFLAGCEQTPMQKLQSNVRHEDLNNVFWGKERSNKTPLWQQAVSFCKEHGEKPNCGAVMQLYVITNGSTEVPKYGSSGHPLEIPNF